MLQSLQFTISFLVCAVCMLAQSSEPFRQEFPAGPGEVIRGAGFRAAGDRKSGTIYTWGNRVLSWAMPSGKVTVLAEGGSEYGPGGCVFDVNADGQPDVLVLERSNLESGAGRMVWLASPNWQSHVAEEGALFSDCLPVEMDGRNGVLVIHRHAQLRFYEIPVDPAGRWPYRELYSIYTPSKQGGLVLSDVDGDGREDIYSGNYWLRTPPEFELPWRLFAINLWYERENSALSSLALADLTGEGAPNLIIGQRAMSESRLAWYERPPDPTILWTEHRLEGHLHLRYPTALITGDFDGDGDADLVAGETNGPGSRLILFRNRGGGKLPPEVIDRHSGLLRAWTADFDTDGKPDVVGAGPSSVAWWPSHFLK